MILISFIDQNYLLITIVEIPSLKIWTFRKKIHELKIIFPGTAQSESRTHKYLFKPV